MLSIKYVRLFQLNNLHLNYNSNNNNNNNNNNEIAKVWCMQKVIVVPVVIGSDGAISHSVNFNEYMKRIGVNVRLEVIQKTALLGTAKILRKVLSL